jgi:hypothetical protein
VGLEPWLLMPASTLRPVRRCQTGAQSTERDNRQEVTSATEHLHLDGTRGPVPIACRVRGYQQIEHHDPGRKVGYDHDDKGLWDDDHVDDLCIRGGRRGLRAALAGGLPYDVWAAADGHPQIALHRGEVGPLQPGEPDRRLHGRPGADADPRTYRLDVLCLRRCRRQQRSRGLPRGSSQPHDLQLHSEHRRAGCR